MVTNKHKLILLGGTHDGVRVSAETLAEALSALIEGARLATRFAVEGESLRKGPRPAWLDAACQIEVTGLAAGSLVVELEAPFLEDAAPERFAAVLFAEAPSSQKGRTTSIDLFGDVLASALTGPSDRILADRALLDSCVRFSRIARGPCEGLQLESLSGRMSPILVRRADVPRLELLRDETPSPRAVRLTGTLDTISASRSDVVLTLEGGEKVVARLEHHDSELLKILFGKRVVVSGLAHFKPSGRLLLIDVEYLALAAESDSLFARIPAGHANRPLQVQAPQELGSGVAAFFGTWPGEETDVELLASLEALG